ncbi:DUF1798 family protein [Virgibacillus alimentarius]|uniref:DUF1798 domain-containing protein n=1 Tax=Virgibacillus alimentarius TaxID=698769 RepID=A0ABS4S4C8_9BACI|nr:MULTISPECIES: DUF1798 family protein [Virgibacillus]MBP2256345.1 hypothetical protein [Virgibacillus alimentarius]HLR66290.1 DUF1798 family protein [Virgibacillus sp.]
MQLIEQTKQFKQHLDYLMKIYEKNSPPESKSDKEFFLKVKEETLPVYRLIEKWEKEALQTIKDRKVNVHPHQISSTKENMELLLMHSYYIDVKRRRYMELNHSIHYILAQLIRELE